MFYTKRLIKNYEVGLVYRDGIFVEVANAGYFKRFDPFNRIRVDKLSERDIYVKHVDKDVLVKTEALAAYTETVVVKDTQRALVWVNDQFDCVLLPGTHLLFDKFHSIAVEIVEAQEALFEHERLAQLVDVSAFTDHVNVFHVQAHERVLLFEDGDRKRMLAPGRYAMWKHIKNIRLHSIDTRERVLDLSGQEIMTADRVSVRFNAVLSYAEEDIERIVSQVENLEQSIYREAQLALRASVGSRSLDSLLESKQALSDEMQEQLRLIGERYGVRMISFGIRDVILPGEMKVLLNKITEAKTSAEANLIKRREEHAAMRSQANTAKLLEQNATLMEMHKLDILLEMVKSNNLQIHLGERSLSDQLNLLM